MSQQSSEISFGSDSFLDVMANMVGILIILVTIAVMHASRSRSTALDAPPVDTGLAALNEQSDSVQRQIESLAGEEEKIQRLRGFRQAECEGLSAQLADRKRRFDAERQKLDAHSRAKQDLQISLASARSQLAEIEGEVVRKRNADSQPETIQCYPTPISHSVNGREIHFRVRGGRIAYVPLEELMELFGREAKERFQLLAERPMVSGVVGPADDFRMKYVLEREALHGGRYKAEATFTFLPVEEQLGETLETALSPGSDFLDLLQQGHARHTTVTLWTYPDSFAIYRAIKKELYGRGFAVAGRPLEMDQPIGASTNGTRSAAQ